MPPPLYFPCFPVHFLPYGGKVQSFPPYGSPYGGPLAPKRAHFSPRRGERERERERERKRERKRERTKKKADDRVRSSVGRALPLQGRGRRFETCRIHPAYL